MTEEESRIELLLKPYHEAKKVLTDEIKFFEEGLAGARADLRELEKKYKTLLKPAVKVRIIDIVYDVAKEMDGKSIEEVATACASRINQTRRSALSYVYELEHRNWAYLVENTLLIRDKVEPKVAFKGAISSEVLEFITFYGPVTLDAIAEVVTSYNKQQIQQALKNMVTKGTIVTVRMQKRGYMMYKLGEKQ